MKAHLVRNERTGQFYIEVRYSQKNKECLFQMIVEHCAKALSNNELKEVYQECSKQLLKLGPDNTPENFNEIMKELSQALINRKCYVENLTVKS